MSVDSHAMGDFFASVGHENTYHKGHVICFQGDRFESVWQVTSGIVKIYDIDRRGSERTISFFAEPDTFPMMWLMAHPPLLHLYYYEALTDATCRVAPMEAARSYLRSHQEALLSMMDALAQDHVNSMGRLQNMEKSHLVERLEFVLYWLTRRIGTVEGQVARIDALITQEDIARLAGVTRESMSLAINKLGSNILWRENHSTYIDLSKLPLSSMPTVYPHDFRG